MSLPAVGVPTPPPAKPGETMEGIRDALGGVKSVVTGPVDTIKDAVMLPSNIASLTVRVVDNAFAFFLGLGLVVLGVVLLLVRPARRGVRAATKVLP